MHYSKRPATASWPQAGEQAEPITTLNALQHVRSASDECGSHSSFLKGKKNQGSGTPKCETFCKNGFLTVFIKRICKNLRGGPRHVGSDFFSKMENLDSSL